MLRIYEEDKPQQITSLCYEMCSDGGCGNIGRKAASLAWRGCVKTLEEAVPELSLLIITFWSLL